MQCKWLSPHRLCVTCGLCVSDMFTHGCSRPGSWGLALVCHDSFRLIRMYVACSLCVGDMFKNKNGCLHPDFGGLSFICVLQWVAVCVAVCCSASSVCCSVVMPWLLRTHSHVTCSLCVVYVCVVYVRVHNWAPNMCVTYSQLSPDVWYVHELSAR